MRSRRTASNGRVSARCSGGSARVSSACARRCRLPARRCSPTLSSTSAGVRKGCRWSRQACGGRAIGNDRRTMTSAAMRIRTLGASELALAIEWAAAEGSKPQGLHDAACFHAADHDGFLVGSLDETPVATISVVKYGATFGFLGLYIVRKEFRADTGCKSGTRGSSASQQRRPRRRRRATGQLPQVGFQVRVSQRAVSRKGRRRGTY